MTLQPGQQRPEPRRRRRQRHAPATGLAACRGRGRARATHSGHAPLLEERPRQLLPATAPSLQPVAPSSPPLLFAASRPSAVPSIIHYLSRPRLLRPSYHHEGSPVEPVLLSLSLSLSLPPHPFSSPLLFFLPACASLPLSIPRPFWSRDNPRHYVCPRSVSVLGRLSYYHWPFGFPRTFVSHPPRIPFSFPEALVSLWFLNPGLPFCLGPDLVDHFSLHRRDVSTHVAHPSAVPRDALLCPGGPPRPAPGQPPGAHQRPGRGCVWRGLHRHRHPHQHPLCRQGPQQGGSRPPAAQVPAA